MSGLPDGVTYDLFVIGGGPAGLMAARTAAADGLRVAMVDKKRDITDVKRTCAQALFSPGAGLGDRFYAGIVGLERAKGINFFCYPDINLKVSYRGPLLPSYQLVYLSPSGFGVKRYRDSVTLPWATIFSKKALLDSLVCEADSVGVRIMPGTTAIAVENRPAGVRVLVRMGAKERWFEAGAVIAADGINSATVEYLGLNKSRRLVGKLAKGVQWVVEGVSTERDYGESACFMIAVPSLGKGMIMVGPFPEAGCDGLTSLIVTSAGERVLERLKSMPYYAAWFRKARLVKRTAYAGWPRTAIRKPVMGKVLVVGDAAAAFETLVPGALASGYQAAKATLRELNGKPGYKEYTQWWLKSFHFNRPGYFKKLKMSAGIPLVALCSDAEIDYLYSRLADRYGDPGVLVRKIMNVVKDERPELFTRLSAW